MKVRSALLYNQDFKEDSTLIIDFDGNEYIVNYLNSFESGDLVKIVVLPENGVDKIIDIIDITHDKVLMYTVLEEYYQKLFPLLKKKKDHDPNPPKAHRHNGTVTDPQKDLKKDKFKKKYILSTDENPGVRYKIKDSEYDKVKKLKNVTFEHDGKTAKKIKKK